MNKLHRVIIALETIIITFSETSIEILIFNFNYPKFYLVLADNFRISYAKFCKTKRFAEILASVFTNTIYQYGVSPSTFIKC